MGSLSSASKTVMVWAERGWMQHKNSPKTIGFMLSEYFVQDSEGFGFSEPLKMQFKIQHQRLQKLLSVRFVHFDSMYGIKMYAQEAFEITKIVSGKHRMKRRGIGKLTFQEVKTNGLH